MRIAQSEEYQGDDWWKWSVWIDATDQELDKIVSVTYTLHPTFREPVKKMTDRGSKFRLSTMGWGIFTLYALVEFTDGHSRKLSHALKLHYPDGTETQA